MAHFVYIIYSHQTDKYYIGESVDPVQRLKQHNQGFYKSASSKIASDWIIFWKLKCATRKQALKIEAHIKKMRNRKYYNNLRRYPEISLKLINRYN